jgi:phosphoribosyl 1,2-cyclic phosphodiesterase
MKLTYWGTRGSTPSPGKHTVRYGGNTPCVVLEHEGALLVLDAGSGIRGVGRELAAEARGGSVDLLLSHVHWDHIQGLPFFAPLYSESWEVRVHGPRPETMSLESALGLQMAPPYFPLHFAAVARRLRVTEITVEPRQVGHFQVTGVVLRHPGRTFGYRVCAAGGGPSASYMTDNELGLPEDWGPLVEFLRGTDVLVHDAMFTQSEADARVGWGHSSVERVVDLGVAAGVGRVTLFHHDPNRGDHEMDRLLEVARARAAERAPAMMIDAATEGQSLVL